MSIRIGTCSWTDKTLLSCGRFYPSPKLSAEERLRFYARRFTTVEVDSSFYGLPSERNSYLWLSRTPDHFLFNIKAYKTLTLHDRSRGATDQEWAMFRQALLPLVSAGRLGYVLFQFPPWFRPGKENLDYLANCQERLPEMKLAVQFRHASWVLGKQEHETFSFLDKQRLAYVSVDEPQIRTAQTMPPLAAATGSFAVVRFNGRNVKNWYAKDIPVVERFRYRYQPDELAPWIEKIRSLEQRTGQVFVMFNNCFEDDAIVNAIDIARLLGVDLETGGEETPQQQTLFEH
ncbi:MAG: DUF72 domain-containing protein [Bacillota bacterium]